MNDETEKSFGTTENPHRLPGMKRIDISDVPRSVIEKLIHDPNGERLSKPSIQAVQNDADGLLYQPYPNPEATAALLEELEDRMGAMHIYPGEKL